MCSSTGILHFPLFFKLLIYFILLLKRTNMALMQDLTKGSVIRQLVIFMIPVLIGVILQRLYALADVILVGQFVDTDALAAVGSSSIIVHMFVTCANGFTNGFSIVIGQYRGANDEENLRKSLAATYVLSFIVAVLLTVISILICNAALTWVNIPEDLFSTGRIYVLILSAGMAFSVLYNMLSNVLRALGDSTIPLIFLIVSVIANIILDAVFIAVLKMGVSGAAWATVISMAIAAIGCLIFVIYRRPQLKVYLKDFKFDRGIYSQLTSQGLALTMMFTIVNFGSVILQRGINTLGKDLIAGFTAGRKYLEFFMLPGMVFSTAITAFTSQNFGARKYDRIRKSIKVSIGLLFAYSTIMLLVAFVFGRFFVISVTGRDAASNIINAGMQYLRTGVLFFYSLFILLVLRCALQGLNHKRVPLIASIIELVCKVAATSWAVPKFGFMAICLTEPVIWVLGAAVVLPYYLFVIKKLERS